MRDSTNKYQIWGLTKKNKDIFIGEIKVTDGGWWVSRAEIEDKAEALMSDKNLDTSSFVLVVCGNSNKPYKNIMELIMSDKDHIFLEH